MAICPQSLVLDPLLPSLLQCAAVAMKMDHRDANSGTLAFLDNTVSFGLSISNASNMESYREALEKAILAEGQPIVNNLAHAILGDLPAYRLDNDRGSIAGVLFKLNQLCPQLLMQWINPPLLHAPQNAKDVFLRALASKIPREEFNSNVRQFSNLCYRTRKLRGDQLARQ